MPRPKKPLEFQEGPTAAENFRALARRLIPTSVPTDHVTVTEKVTIEFEPAKKKSVTRRKK
jgi:hypothetical protein